MLSLDNFGEFFFLHKGLTNEMLLPLNSTLRPLASMVTNFTKKIQTNASAMFLFNFIQVSNIIFFTRIECNQSYIIALTHFEDIIYLVLMSTDLEKFSPFP